MRIVGRIGNWTAGLFGALAVLSLVAFGALMALGYRPVAVYSGSMEPKLPVGSLVLVKPVGSERIGVGDVITFNDPRVRGRLITHRVVKAIDRPRGRAFRTKGDANTTLDPWTIVLPGQVGRYQLDVPYAGYALVYVKTREVRTGFILAAALLILLALLRQIWRPVPPRSAPVEAQR